MHNNQYPLNITSVSDIQFQLSYLICTPFRRGLFLVVHLAWKWTPLHFFHATTLQCIPPISPFAPPAPVIVLTHLAWLFQLYMIDFNFLPLQHLLLPTLSKLAYIVSIVLKYAKSLEALCPVENINSILIYWICKILYTIIRNAV